MRGSSPCDLRAYRQFPIDALTWRNGSPGRIRTSDQPVNSYLHTTINGDQQQKYRLVFSQEISIILDFPRLTAIIGDYLATAKRINFVARALPKRGMGYGAEATY